MLRGNSPLLCFGASPLSLPVSSRCEAETNAGHAFPSARSRPRPGSFRLVAIGAGVLWTLHWWLVGGLCPAVAADITTPVTATWSGIGLRQWAERISETAGLPVLVDRRLDPDTVIRLECQGEPLLAVLTRVAVLAGGELATLESSIRIVPPGMADQTIRAEAARTARIASLPPRQRAVVMHKEPWQWPAGARPQNLLKDATTQAGISLDGIDAVPHDHLAAVSLPSMTLAERLDLLLAPYDLRIDWRVAQPAAEDKTPPALTGRIIAIASGLTATTSAAAAAQPTAPPRSSRPRASRQKAAVGDQTFSLKVAAPLEEVLAAIATRLGLKLDLDRDSLTRSGIAPAEIVRASVTDASRDELLHAILDPLALEWTVKESTLRVFATSK